MPAINAGNNVSAYTLPQMGGATIQNYINTHIEPKKRFNVVSSVNDRAADLQNLRSRVSNITK